MMRSASGRFAIAFLMFVAFSFGALMYALFFEEPYLSYENLPFPPLTPIVIAGDVVPLQVQRCNRSDNPKTYEIEHSLKDVERNTTIVLPSLVVQIEPGCHKSVSLINLVPAETPSGRYRVVGLAKIQGFLRPHLVEWYSGEFVVVGRDLTGESN